jgi:bifunctional non-homologous end joining protein LigD
MPRQIDVPLATLKAAVPEGNRWHYEIEYDSYRMLARIEHTKTTFIARNHHDWAERFAELAESVTALPLRAGAILDGELVKFGDDGISRFSALQHALSTKRTDELAFIVFHLPYLAGYDLRSARLDDCKAVLHIVRPLDPCKPLVENVGGNLFGNITHSVRPNSLMIEPLSPSACR